MTPQQLGVFQQSTGVTPANLTLVIASIVAVILLLWGCWMAYSQYKMWQNGQGSFYDMTFNLARCAMMMLLLGFLIR